MYKEEELIWEQKNSDEFTEEEVRLVRIKFISEMAN